MKKTEPVSLLDIKPLSEQVHINEKQSIEVRGISTDDIFNLLKRFPPLQGIIVGREITLADIFAFGPEIVGAVCAAATGKLGNEEAEKIASTLSVEIQLEIIQAVGRCTFTRGFGPFVQKFKGIVGALSAGDGKAPDTNSQRPSKPLEEQPTQVSGI